MKNWRRSARDSGAVVSCGIVPTDVSLVAGTSSVTLEFVSAEDPESWLVQLIECGNPSNVLIDTGIPGIDRGWEPLVPGPGLYAVRIREFNSDPSCWVTSNCVEVE